uniref:DUF6816 domain-containing protein n=1 Tax=Hanusia phi TaxID=3032 RepID=A0A7S0E9Z8_9CRYP
MRTAALAPSMSSLAGICSSSMSSRPGRAAVSRSLLWLLPAMLFDGKERICPASTGWKKLPSYDQQLYLAPWMFGEWRCVEELTGRSGGEEELQELSAACPWLPLRGRVGSRWEYDVRFYSTLADSLENNLRVNLGLGVPRAEIIEDRAFNILRVSSALTQQAGCHVKEVHYDSRSPTRAQLYLAEPEGGGAKVDLLITDRTRCGSGDSFSCSESFRATSYGEGGRKRELTYKVEQELHLAADGNVSGKKFIDLDLPGSLKVTCELGLVLSRKLGDDESICCETPKQVVQCQPPRFWKEGSP